MTKFAQSFAAATLILAFGLSSAAAFEVNGDVDIKTEQEYSPALVTGDGSHASVGTLHACGTDFGGDLTFTSKQKYSPALVIGDNSSAHVGSVLLGDNSCFKR